MHAYVSNYPDRVSAAPAHHVHVCEVPGLGVVLEVSTPHQSHLAAQVQLLAQVSAPLHVQMQIQSACVGLCQLVSACVRASFGHDTPPPDPLHVAVCHAKQNN